MKVLLPLFLVALLFSCAKPEIIEETAKAQLPTCHQQANAVVEYREAGQDGRTPFFYLAILNEEGRKITDVYAGQLPAEFREIGTKVTIVYNESYRGDHSYVSACGPDGDGVTVYESMKEVTVCSVSPMAS
jgi:hypothetical protein